MPCRTRRSQDFQQLVTASVFLWFWIALKKSGTGIEGIAADDKTRCFGVHSETVVEETKRLWCVLACESGAKGRW